LLVCPPTFCELAVRLAGALPWLPYLFATVEARVGRLVLPDAFSQALGFAPGYLIAGLPYDIPDLEYQIRISPGQYHK
jgi:hypothetical protein